ncbi:MAG: flagellar export protein FliJ [Chromatiales bacterium]|nr:flagellar export protein FliJ [Chromatiales bacterium]
MNRSKRLEPVARVADNRQENAARFLGQCQRELAASEHQLQELVAYREEYIRRFDDAARQGIDAVAIHEYRAFMLRLNQAIEQQSRAVDSARVKHEKSRVQWLEARSRAHAIDAAIGRFREDELRVADKREQFEVDDRSQHRRTPGGHE